MATRSVVNTRIPDAVGQGQGKLCVLAGYSRAAASCPDSSQDGTWTTVICLR
jgi:hypothetical protein